MIWLVLPMALANPPEAKALSDWLLKHGNICAWGQADLGEGPATVADVCKGMCATIVQFGDKRWALFAGDYVDCPKLGKLPEWETAEGKRDLVRELNYGNNVGYERHGIRDGQLVKLYGTAHQLGGMPPPPLPPTAWNYCRPPPFNVFSTAHGDERMFETPIGQGSFDPTYRARGELKPHDRFGGYPTRESITCDAPPDGGSGMTHRIAQKGTTQLAITHGAERWTGLDDGYVELKATEEGADLVVDVLFGDDDVTKVAERTPKGFLKGDHLEIWWVSAAYDPGPELEVDEWIVDADFGPVPKTWHDTVGSDAVADIRKRLNDTRQLGIAEVDGKLATVWLHPEGLDESPPPVEAIDGGVRIRLAKSSLSILEHKKDWMTRFTAALHDVDGGKVTMIATSQLHWNAPGSFGILRSFAESPYEADGTPIEEGADPFEVLDL